MEDFRKKIQEEVDRNYAFFKRELPNIITGRFGQYALLRDSAVVDYFDTFGDAEKYAALAFKDRMYSIQKVEDSVIDLGIMGTLLYA